MRRLRQDMQNMKRGHFWVGMPYLTRRLASLSDELRSSVATTRRSVIMGLSRVGYRPKLLTDC
jgi:hypothetical protein